MRHSHDDRPGAGARGADRERAQERPDRDRGATGYFRLVQAGWKFGDLAKATGRSAKHVAAPLALRQLPAGVRTKVDAGQIGVGEAAELLKLRHHPELLVEVARAIVEDEFDDIGWAVRHALIRAERQAKRPR